MDAALAIGVTFRLHRCSVPLFRCCVPFYRCSVPRGRGKPNAGAAFRLVIRPLPFSTLLLPGSGVDNTRAKPVLIASDGGIAQPGKRLVRNQKVGSSILPVPRIPCVRGRTKRVCRNGSTPAADNKHPQ